MDLTRAVVAITGGSAGIGHATAVRLAREGAAVAICGRSRERLDPVVAQVREAGGRALGTAADVTNEGDMAAFVASTVDTFGRLDVMICNAGFGIAGAIDDVSAGQMRRLLDVNYMGTYHAARAAMPVFRRQRRGHLIVVSSIVGRRGVPMMGAYAATKFAQVGLAESLRAELAGTGIHVTVVFPISTATEFLRVMERETGAPIAAIGPRQSAARVADAIARAIERPVAEVYPHRGSRALVWLNAVAPALCDRVMKKYGRKPLRPDSRP